jgi:two-component system osmolarity sensor histidine kinase EnvZ
MYTYIQRPNWFNSGLFWRTFCLLVLLATASMAAWFISFKLVERKPRAQQISGQIISTVTITRAALTHSAEDKRRQLLVDLANAEDMRIYPLEETDQVRDLPTSVFSTELSRLVKGKLGAETRFAQEVNGETGFWVSFNIENDAYWLRLDNERIQAESGLQFLGWASATLLFTIIGAAFISRFINAPLAQLNIAARMLAKGKQPPTLPETGPKEIRETNASFNQMIEDLARVESDRTLVLAGISHDLRTPITRLLLEIEMAPLDDKTRTGMQSDLTQMDGIIHQFLDYARPLDAITFSQFNLSNVVTKVIDDFRRGHDLFIQSNIRPDIQMNGSEVEIQRLFNNIFENALRYGRTEKTNQLQLELTIKTRATLIKAVDQESRQQIFIKIRDHGSGVPEAELNRLLRPFTRVDASRSQANGAGLGLAIVARIIKRHGGKIQISNHLQGGFLVLIEL